MTDEIRRLGQTGNVYVTYAAAKAYAQEYDLEIEPARRELTAHLVMASQPESERGREGPQEVWRRRNKAAGIDITARVVREGPLAVVVAINVRDHVTTERGPAYWRNRERRRNRDR